MQSLEQTLAAVAELNEQAYQKSWHSWVAADEMPIAEVADGMKKDAYHEQTAYFRDGFSNLDAETKSSIMHWLQQEEFRTQFSIWYGQDEFVKTFALPINPSYLTST